MGTERPQGKSYQRFLFPELEEDLRHGTTGEGGTGPGVREESQLSTASDPTRALTERTSFSGTQSYKHERNRRIRKVRPVVWEDGGREAPSYPIRWRSGRSWRHGGP